MLFTDNEAIIALTAELMLLIAIYQLSDAIQGLSISMLRGLQDVRIVMPIVLCSYLLLNIPIGCLLAYRFDMECHGLAIGGGMAFFEEQYGSKEVAEAKLNKAGYELIEDMETLKATKGKRRVMALLGAKEVGEDSGSYLAEATAEAIRLFEERGDKGFALMVEGSLIDGMGHGNDAKAQQKEMDSFMQAVEVAVKYAEKSGNTLVVVTADHETGGLSIVSGNADFNLSEQGIEYRWTTDGHSGQMVPIYLYGAGAERINGIMENAELGAKLKALISE